MNITCGGALQIKMNGIKAIKEGKSYDRGRLFFSDIVKKKQ